MDPLVQLVTPGMNDVSIEVGGARRAKLLERTVLPVVGHLVERAAIDESDLVLDLACGTGLLTIATARRGAIVAGIDESASLLDRAREYASLPDVPACRWYEGTGSNLPFEAGVFDATLSSLGPVMTQPTESQIEEMSRVTSPGGRIGFATWSAGSLYPTLCRTVTESVPNDVSTPPRGPHRESAIRAILSNKVDGIAFEHDSVTYPARSPADFWKRFSSSSDDIADLLAVVPAETRPVLRDELLETIELYFDDRQNAVELDYLLTMATR